MGVRPEFNRTMDLGGSGYLGLMGNDQKYFGDRQIKNSCRQNLQRSGRDGVKNYSDLDRSGVKKSVLLARYHTAERNTKLSSKTTGNPLNFDRSTMIHKEIMDHSQKMSSIQNKNKDLRMRCPVILQSQNKNLLGPMSIAENDLYRTSQGLNTFSSSSVDQHPRTASFEDHSGMAINGIDRNYMNSVRYGVHIVQKLKKNQNLEKVIKRDSDRKWLDRDGSFSVTKNKFPMSK